MNLGKRVASGLAWAGVLLVVGVPAADFVVSRTAPASAGLAGGDLPEAETPAAVETAEAEAVVPVATVPAEVVPAVTATAEPPKAASLDPVEQFTQTGKPLPSYISDGGDVAAVVPETPAPTPVVETAAVPKTSTVTVTDERGGKTPDAKTSETKTAETKTATVETAPKVVIEKPASSVSVTQTEAAETVASLTPAPELVAPVPMPVSMRPRPQVMAPIETVRTVDTADVDDFAPPADIPAPQTSTPSGFVNEADLADWHSGSLSDFLAQRGQVSQPLPQPGSGDTLLRFDENGYLITEDPPLESQF